MRYALACCFFLVTSLFACAQAQQNRLFLEIAGSAGLGSLNFEHDFTHKGSWDHAYRLGISAVPGDINTGMTYIFPVAISSRFGAGAHKLELAAGVGLSITTKGKFSVAYIPQIGYRYQKQGARAFFRATYTPIVSFLRTLQWQQWGGISLGINLGGKS